MFLDFALISGLLVVAHLLRSRIRLFQAILLPTPILAGLIGLAAGSEGLDLIPFARDEGGAPVMRRYPGEFVILLFATLFMGSRADGPGIWGSCFSRTGPRTPSVGRSSRRAAASPPFPCSRWR